MEADEGGAGVAVAFDRRGGEWALMPGLLRAEIASHRRGDI